jgi:hypothetical protein
MPRARPPGASPPPRPTGRAPPPAPPPAQELPLALNARHSRDECALLASRRRQSGHRAQQRRDEHFERHLRAHRVAREADDGHALEDRGRLRPAGLHRDCRDDGAERFQRFAHDFVVAHRNAARGEDEVGSVGGFVERCQHEFPVIGNVRPEGDNAASRSDGGDERGAVRVEDLAEGWGVARLDEFASGGDDRHANRAAHLDSGEPGGGEHREMPGCQPQPRGQQLVARVQVAAFLPHVLAHGALPRDGDRGAVTRRVFDGNDRVRALRHDRAGHDAHGGARDKRVGVAGPC